MWIPMELVARWWAQEMQLGAARWKEVLGERGLGQAKTRMIQVVGHVISVLTWTHGLHLLVKCATIGDHKLYMPGWNKKYLKVWSPKERLAGEDYGAAHPICSSGNTEMDLADVVCVGGASWYPWFTVNSFLFYFIFGCLVEHHTGWWKTSRNELTCFANGLGKSQPVGDGLNGSARLFIFILYY